MATTLTTTCDACGKSDKDSLPVYVTVSTDADSHGYGTFHFCSLHCLSLWLWNKKGIA